jgi:hypothetical protein
LITVDALAWICFNIQWARYEPEHAAIFLQLNSDIPRFKSIFQHVYLMEVETSETTVTLHFHCVDQILEKLKLFEVR